LEVVLKIKKSRDFESAGMHLCTLAVTAVVAHENVEELNTISCLDAGNSVVLNLSTIQNYDYLKVLEKRVLHFFF
jgi:hypothetical protein